jgi:hypothetical protein
MKIVEKNSTSKQALFGGAKLKMIPFWEVKKLFFEIKHEEFKILGKILN